MVHQRTARVSTPANHDIVERVEPVHICGLATTTWAIEHDAVLDELVYDCVATALQSSGLRKHQVGLVSMASLDVYDGRSISTGLTTPAAGGYLTDSYRVEGDVGEAIIAGTQAIRSGHVDVVVAAGLHHPEVRNSSTRAHTAFLEQVSNLAFDPHFNRPVAMTASAVLGMQASSWLAEGDRDVRALADIAAAEINRAVGTADTTRNEKVRVEDVLASAPVAWPLTELMMPAHTAGAGAVVLASEAVARRARESRARILGTGSATSSWTFSEDWLVAPAAAASRAAAAAYRRSGLAIDAPDLDLIEMTAVTPALVDVMTAALGGRDDVTVCPFGGARTGFPGVANGILRLSQAINWLQTRAGHGRAAVHSTDMIAGPFSETSTVLVVEAA